MTPVGLEPTIPGSVGRCLIHWATGPLSIVRCIWHNVFIAIIIGSSPDTKRTREREKEVRTTRHQCREAGERRKHGITSTRSKGVKYMVARSRDPRARSTRHHGREIHRREIHGGTGARSTGAKYTAARARNPQARNTQHHVREIRDREIHSITAAKLAGAKYMASRAREPVLSWVEPGHESRASLVILASLVVCREPVWSSLPVWSWVESQSGRGSGAILVVGREGGTRRCAVLASSCVVD